MQIQFDSENMVGRETADLLAIILPKFAAKLARDGDDLDRVQAMVANIIAIEWSMNTPQKDA